MSSGEKGNRAPERAKDGGTHVSKDEGAARLKKAKEELPHGEGGIHNPKPGSIDYASLAKSNRALHKQATGSGKGDDPRPRSPAISELEYSRRWCLANGHKWRAGWPLCLNACGMTKKGQAR